MKAEGRLIDAKQFDLCVSKHNMSDVFPNWKDMPVDIQDAVCKHAQYLHMLLEIQPTIDAVKVVRCGSCRYRHTRHTCAGRPMDFFCADGER